MPEPDDTTKNVKDEQKNISEQTDSLLEYEWLVRPCEIYKEEYNDCKSIRARFHQYFVLGETIECGQWKTDYHNCYLWQKYKTEKARAALIESEQKRRLKRLQDHYKNNVWEKRDAPPEDWNAPLPKWLQEKFERSYLKYMSEEMKQSSEPSTDSKTKSYCTIM